MSFFYTDQQVFFKEVTTKSLNSIIEDKVGYTVIQHATNSPADTLWPIILENFGDVFAIKKPSQASMRFVHLDKSKSKYFKELTVEKRTLRKKDANRILCTDWIQDLSRLLEKDIVDTYDNGYATFTWRITRPCEASDFRPIHKDVWFRLAAGGKEIFDDTQSKHLQRISAWIPLNTIKGKSGLYVVPESQLSDHQKFSKIHDGDHIKPKINQKYLVDSDPKYAVTPEGTIALWGQNFLHGGAPNISNECRISVEFTLCSKYQSLFNTYTLRSS